MFTTPKKQRNPAKAHILVRPLLHGTHQRKLEQDLRDLLYGTEKSLGATPNPAYEQLDANASDSDSIMGDLCPEPEPGPLPYEQQLEDDTPDGDIIPPNNVTPRSRRILPNSTAHSLYNRWMAALPNLVAPLLQYISRTTGQVPVRVMSLASDCSGSECERKSCQILCLFQDCESYFFRPVLPSSSNP